MAFPPKDSIGIFESTVDSICCVETDVSQSILLSTRRASALTQELQSAIPAPFWMRVSIWLPLWPAFTLAYLMLSMPMGLTLWWARATFVAGTMGLLLEALNIVVFIRMRYRFPADLIGFVLSSIAALPIVLGALITLDVLTHEVRY